MAGVLGALAGGVAERFMPLLQTPVEDIIYEVLDQKGLPTRAEVRELRNKLDRLEKSFADLQAASDALVQELAAARAALEAAPAVAAPAPAKASAPVLTVVAPSEPATCKVDGCDAPVRAKGLCGKHYQRWKRGTLEGWVGFDGSTVHDNVRYRVDEAASGQPVVTRYEGDEVIFLLPEESGREIRARVNDVRIDD